MSRFVLVSDPHVTVPNPDTGWFPPNIPEPTMYRESVALFEAAVAAVNAIPDVDFVLVAGDLTKDSEPYNHDKARELLSGFRRPVYCVPGNHDQPRPPRLRPPEFVDPTVPSVTLDEFPRLYGDFGFDDPRRLAYSHNPTPDVHLVGLCSPKPDRDHGEIPGDILAWLDADLAAARRNGAEPIVMLHHSIVEHVPGERVNPNFYWFHVKNAEELKALLRRHGVSITLTGHLHMQDVKEEDGLYNIATASLASYPHAYRVFDLKEGELEIRSRRLESIPSMPRLQEQSRRMCADVFEIIVRDGLMAEPFCMDKERAAWAAKRLREWWPRMAEGEEQFSYTADDVGSAALAAYVNAFSDRPPPDNDLTIELPAARR